MKFLKQKVKFKATSVRNVMDGTFFYKKIVANNLGFIVFCTLLLSLQIGNTFAAEEELARIAILEKRIKNLRYESVTASAELMSVSRRSEVLRFIKARNLGLEESVKAPQRIYIEKD